MKLPTLYRALRGGAVNMVHNSYFLTLQSYFPLSLFLCPQIKFGAQYNRTVCPFVCPFVRPFDFFFFKKVCHLNCTFIWGHLSRTVTQTLVHLLFVNIFVSPAYHGRQIDIILSIGGGSDFILYWNFNNLQSAGLYILHYILTNSPLVIFSFK